MSLSEGSIGSSIPLNADLITGAELEYNGSNVKSMTDSLFVTGLRLAARCAYYGEVPLLLLSNGYRNNIRPTNNSDHRCLASSDGCLVSHQYLHDCFPPSILDLFSKTSRQLQKHRAYVPEDISGRDDYIYRL